MKIQIQSGIPVASRFALTGKDASLRAALVTMKPGDSFLWPENKTPYRCADQVGVRITTRKVSGEGYRVWRVK